MQDTQLLLITTFFIFSFLIVLAFDIYQHRKQH